MNTDKTNKTDEQKTDDCDGKNRTTKVLFTQKSSQNDDTGSTKPILILANPMSGRGKSIKTLDKVILPMLEADSVAYELCVTEANKRICHILCESNKPNLNETYRLILVVSGDGLLHECVNTILARSDWHEAIQTPLGIIPTGSGNGMAYTLIRQHLPDLKAGLDAIRLCSRQAIQARQTCMSDLVRLTYSGSEEKAEQKTIWSFLSLGWGLLSDIDVDSDWLRPLGEFRFTIYGLLRACTARSQRGRLSYQPLQMESTTSTHPTLGGNNNHSVVVNCDTLTTTTTTTTASENTNSELEQQQSLASSSNWVHIEDKFACLYAVYQTHISSSTKFSPQSTPADQIIYLTFIRGKLSPIKTVKFLLAIEDGTHDRLPFVNVVPVRKFTFEPLEAHSKIVVDGERIPWTVSDGPLTAEIEPSMMKILWDSNID